MPKKEIKNRYDLEERTAEFGECIIEFVKRLPVNDIVRQIIPQLVRSSISVGANYCEADCAESNKDFIHKMAIANKEIKETKHHIRMAAKACPQYNQEARVLWKEGHELNLIFTTIIKKAKTKMK